MPRTTSPALADLVADPAPERRAALWRRVAQEGTPLVEEVPGSPDERIYTFLHRDFGGARRVFLDVQQLVDATTYTGALMEQVPGTTLWSLSLRMPAAWRATYALAVDDGHGPTASRSVAADVELRREQAKAALAPDLHAAVDDWCDLLLRSEPDALAREHALLGDDSVASGPHAPALPPGVVGVRVGEQLAPGPRGSTMRATGFGERSEGTAGRRAWWHVPPVTPGPDGWDVLVLLDGDAWIGAGLRALDAAFAAGVIRPAVVLLVGCGNAERRTADLSCSRDYVAELGRLLAEADGELLGGPVTTDPARTTVAGHGLGGLTALWAQCVAPHRFGASVYKSATWWWPGAVPVPDGEAPEAVSGHAAQDDEWLRRAVGAAAEEPGWRLGRVHLEVGTGEAALRGPTRRMRDALDGRCARLTYRELPGGQDPACWAVQLLSVLADG